MTNKVTALDKLLAMAWEEGYNAGNLDGYFGTHDKATNPYTGVNQYDEEELR